MILNDGTDTREEVRRPGPYCDGMAVVLSQDTGQDYHGLPDVGEGCERYGRRVFWWTSTGFLSTTRYANEADALAAMDEAYPLDDDE